MCLIYSPNIESPVTTTSILRNSPNYFKVTPNTLLATQPHTVGLLSSEWTNSEQKWSNFHVIPFYQSFPVTTSSSNSIWSPNMFDNCSTTNAWNQMTATPSTSNCYQNYAGYYSNIDYLNSTAQQQLVWIIGAIYICTIINKFNHEFFILARKCSRKFLDEKRR